jgi:nicotinamide-nucleotide amidase
VHNATNSKNNLDKTVTKVIQLLRIKNLKISTAESCTGGMIAELVTSVGGASEVFEYGFVTYSEDAKILLLDPEMSGGLAETIRNSGVVSNETARAMSICLMTRVSADIYVAVTGCAGPGCTYLPDGTPQKVGEVYISFTYVSENRPLTFSRKLRLWECPDTSRAGIRHYAAVCIFNELLKFLEEYV